MAIARTSQRSELSQAYNSRPAVGLGKLKTGCIIWIRTKSSIDQHIPGLTDRFKGEAWVYDHPCLVLDCSEHGTPDHIVTVAPITSHPAKPPSPFLPIFHDDRTESPYLSLRNSRKLKVQSYVKKVCFEIDVRMLECWTGAHVDAFRLSKASMKKVFVDMPAVRPWSFPAAPTLPATNKSLSPSARPVIRSHTVLDISPPDVEAQLLIPLPGLSVKRQRVSRGARRRISSVGMWCSSLWATKLVLCLLLLVVLVMALLVRFIVDIVSKGPSTTCDAAVRLLMKVRAQCLADIIGSC